MNIDINKVYAAFPMEKYRDGQQDALKFIVDSINAGKQYIILEMPTGAGKSPIGVAIARSFESAYSITASKQLQDQMNSDFGENGKYGDYVVSLKGRNAYECTFRKRKALESLASKKITKAKAAQWQHKYFSCDEGKCREVGIHRFKECVDENQCQYYTQVAKAQVAQTVNMNFSSFLYQTCFTDRFGKRDIMVIDEAHQIESQLMGFVALTLTNKDVVLTIPEFETPEEYANWMTKIDILTMLDTEMAKRLEAGEVKIFDKLEAMKKKCEFFMNTMAMEHHDAWVCEFDDSGRITKVEFKPVYVHKYAKDYIFSQADIVIMMSATILNVNVFAKSLGIPKELIAAKRMASRFPAENHPIYYKPIVKVTGGNDQKKRWGPPMVKEVNRIVKSHKGQRGIIHTHNFAISRLLIEDCTKDVSKRFLFQENFKTKAEMVDCHTNSTDTIIVAPAMHEGLDLYDDLSRFQIICKIPFPNFYEDRQLAARMKDDDAFYRWLTCLKIVQSVGRSVRSETDHAETYIIDESFGWWFKQNEVMLPKWFKDGLEVGKRK